MGRQRVGKIVQTLHSANLDKYCSYHVWSGTRLKSVNFYNGEGRTDGRTFSVLSRVASQLKILILVILQKENGLIPIFSVKVEHKNIVTMQNNLKNNQKKKQL